MQVCQLTPKIKSLILKELRFKLMFIGLILIFFFPDTYSQPVVSLDQPEITHDIEARIRNGNTGFEAALFTPSTPAPGEPGGGEWQLNPQGAPVWIYDSIYTFEFTFTSSTGYSTFSIDFNRNGIYEGPETEEFTSNTTDSLINEKFQYVNIVLQGENSGLTVQIIDLIVNNSNFGNALSTSDTAVNKLFTDISGQFDDIAVSAKFSFSGGGSQERPRIQIYLGNSIDTNCYTALTPVIPDTIFGECEVSITNPAIAYNSCSDTIIGTTLDPLTYYEPGTYSITWSFDDLHGNTASSIQTVILVDTSPPVPEVEMLPDLIGECYLQITDVATATDCGNIIYGEYNDTTFTLGSHTMTWTFKDGYGNITTQQQNIIVIDTTPPVPILDTLPVIQNSCFAAITEIPRAHDECSHTILAKTNDPLVYTNIGEFNHTWYFDDGNGNISTQIQKIIVDEFTEEDINRNGVIGPSDLAIILNGFQQPCVNCEGDIDKSGTIGPGDLARILNKYGKTCDVIDIEGNIYSTAIIDQQVWMAENLRTTTYNDGVPIEYGTTWDTTQEGAFDYVGNDSANYYNPYGLLYNGHVISEDICPTGWRLPNEADWDSLANYLGGYAVAGGKLKEQDTVHWNAPNTDATNVSNFNALPGGYKDNTGSFYGINTVGYYWSATEITHDTAIGLTMTNTTGSLNKNGYNKNNGFSIRCIKE